MKTQLMILPLLLLIDSGITLEIRNRQNQPNQIDTSCECVPYYQCNPDGTPNEDGRNIIDIRIDTGTPGKRKCEHYLSVCCSVLNMKSVPQTSPSRGQPGKGVAPVQTSQKQNPKQYASRGCGYRNSNGIGFRIIGNANNEANFAEFPWTVAVMREDSEVNNKVYQCGGSLIHKRVVLTAAHCVRELSASKITVRAGEWDTQTQNEPLPHQDRQVSVINIHPEHNQDSVYFDFALLILLQPFDLAGNVETACLPTGEEFDRNNCVASGWGKNSFGREGHYQVILKAVDLAMVSQEKCQNNLRQTILGKYFKLHKSFLCAGGLRGVDTCTGDGGSPLVCPLKNNPQRYVQAGIVSWGIGCGQENTPGVYARVTEARGWIDKTLQSYKIDKRSYTY